MKLSNRVKYEKTINVIILMKLLKGHYNSFYTAIHIPDNSYLYCYPCFQIVPKGISLLII